MLVDCGRDDSGCEDDEFFRAGKTRRGAAVFAGGRRSARRRMTARPRRRARRVVAFAHIVALVEQLFACAGVKVRC